MSLAKTLTENSLCMCACVPPGGGCLASLISKCLLRMLKLLIVLLATNSVHFVQPGVIQVSDGAKLHSFVKSYNLGATIIKG